MTAGPGTISAMEVSEHIAALDRDGRLLAAAAGRAGLAADVPSCPPWQVRDLLRHIGYVHRWAGGYIIERRTEPVPDRPDEPELLRSGPDDAGLVDWYRDGHARLVQALETADPDLVCYYFLDAPSPRAFWARRQAHETAVHRVDAELAAGGPVTPVASGFGADGVDELIMGFFARDADNLTEAQRDGGRRTLEMRATDTGAAWHLALTDDGKLATSVGRGPARSDCGLAGPAAGLYLLLWNRADPAAAQVEVSGDESVLASWQEGMRVTWE
jgi:uncharacterized protein (TIGR03083 family)